MSAFTVVAAQKKKDVEGRNGPMQVIALDMRKPGEEAVTKAEWFTKATTPIPAAGSTLDGELELTDYGFKFKKASGGFNNGPRPEDPARAKRILRQHSQDMAIQTLMLAAKLGTWPRDDVPATVKDLVSVIKTLADVYDKDANGAAE